MKILAIPGSLRPASSSNVLLKKVATMFPSTTEVRISDLVGRLPHFDDPRDAPPVVREFRNEVATADAVLICTPEYAFGIPGALKNALDWCVGSGEFINKPVAVVTASSSGEKGHAALLLVLAAISAVTNDRTTLLISGIRAKIDSTGNIVDQKTAHDLRMLTGAMINVPLPPEKIDPCERKPF
jgi:chromate reductase, NAD(P)H dehydrogenase (quinone)